MGIDYSMGKSNRDPETGISYGIIQATYVGQPWYDSSEAYYGNPHCPICEEAIEDDTAVACEHCGEVIEDVPPEDRYPDEPLSFYVDDDEYTLEQLYDDPDIWILKSPYFTYTEFCSPCAPGAGYISGDPEVYQRKFGDNPEEAADCKAFCLGPEWWWYDPTPCDIYRVSDGQLVLKAGEMPEHQA